jgi:hypothetical protein
MRCSFFGSSGKTRAWVDAPARGLGVGVRGLGARHDACDLGRGPALAALDDRLRLEAVPRGRLAGGGRGPGLSAEGEEVGRGLVRQTQLEGALEPAVAVVAVVAVEDDARAEPVHAHPDLHLLERERLLVADL